MKRTIRLALIGLVLALSLVLAQVHTRSVHGVVTDQNGTPLQGAVVQLTNPDDLQIRSYVTQADGAYQFHQLFDNVSYQIRAQYHGASSSTKSISKFSSNEDAVINLSVPVKK